MLKRNGTFGRRHVDDFHAADVHAKVAHLLEVAIVSGSTQWHSHFLAGQLARVVFVDFQSFGHDTVVVVGIGHGHVEDLQVLTSRGSNHERRNALAHRQLNVAGCHGRAHRGAGVKADPVDLGAHGLFVHAFFLGKLERHGPLEEVGDCDFAVSTGHRGGGGKRRHSTGNHAECEFLHYFVSLDSQPYSFGTT